MVWKAAFIVLLTTLAAGYCSGGDNPTFRFLNTDASARAAALGGSFISIVNDPNGIFTNPAILGTIESRKISFGFSKLLLDINAGSASYAQNLGEDGSVGGSVRYFNYGSITRTDEVGNNLGSFTPSDLAVSVSYANLLSENLYYGISARFIYSSIADYSSTGLGCDLGILYLIPEKFWSFGLSVTNLGTQLKSYISTKEPLPVSVSIGATKQLEHLPLLFNIALHDLNNGDGSFGDRFKAFSFGGELSLSSVVKLRLGYNNQRRQDMKLGSTAGLAGFSIGTGILVKGYQFDYAFNSLGNVGATHLVNISTQF